MRYYLEPEIDTVLPENETETAIPETETENETETEQTDIPVMRGKLYENGRCLGVVEKRDMRNNGSHGYAILKEKEQPALMAHAKSLFPDAENPVVDFLDILFMEAEERLKESKQITE